MSYIQGLNGRKDNRAHAGEVAEVSGGSKASRADDVPATNGCAIENLCCLYNVECRPHKVGPSYTISVNQHRF